MPMGMGRTGNGQWRLDRGHGRRLQERGRAIGGCRVRMGAVGDGQWGRCVAQDVEVRQGRVVGGWAVVRGGGCPWGTRVRLGGRRYGY